MKDTENNKKKVALSITALVIVAILVLVLGTYAYWQITKKQSERNRVGSACLNITFTEVKDGENYGDIYISDMWPTSDLEGSSQTGQNRVYKFTVENTCDTLVNYTVALEEINDDSTGNPIEEADYLNNSYLKVLLDKNTPSIYSALADMTDDKTELNYVIRDTKKIITRRLAGKTSRSHELRLWLDENTPLYEDPEHETGANTNKKWLGKIKIIAGQGINEECYAVNSEGLLYSYDADCGKSAIVPATVNGNQVKTIGTNAFKGETLSYTYYTIDTDPVASEAEMLDELGEDGYCNNGVSSQALCTIDYSIVYAGVAADLYKGITTGTITQEQMMEYIPQLTTDNIYVIKYNNDSSSPQYSHIDESIEAMLTTMDNENFTPWNQNMGSKIIKNDIQIYEVGTDALPDEGDGISEMFYGADYKSSSWGSHYLGSRIPSDKNYGLVIDSLDLSQATNLRKIENRAFSNAPELNENVLEQGSASLQELISSIRPGLTSLTFGSNARNIEFGWASFAKSNLATLTISSLYHVPVIGTFEPVDEDMTAEEIMESNLYGMDKNDYDAIYATLFGAFGGSTINTLNVTSSSATFNPGSGNAWAWGSMCVGSNNCGEIPIVFFSSLFGANWSKSNNTHTTIGTLNVNSGIETIGSYAFVGCEIGSLNLPSSLKTIKNAAFGHMTGSSKTIHIPSAVTTIENDAFNLFDGTIYVPTQSLVDSKADWAERATVLLES